MGSKKRKAADGEDIASPATQLEAARVKKRLKKLRKTCDRLIEDVSAAAEEAVRAAAARGPGAEEAAGAARAKFEAAVPKLEVKAQAWQDAINEEGRIAADGRQHAERAFATAGLKNYALEHARFAAAQAAYKEAQDSYAQLKSLIERYNGCVQQVDDAMDEREKAVEKEMHTDGAAVAAAAATARRRAAAAAAAAAAAVAASTHSSGEQEEHSGGDGNEDTGAHKKARPPVDADAKAAHRALQPAQSASVAKARSKIQELKEGLRQQREEVQSGPMASSGSQGAGAGNGFTPATNAIPRAQDNHRRCSTGGATPNGGGLLGRNLMSPPFTGGLRGMGTYGQRGGRAGSFSSLRHELVGDGGRLGAARAPVPGFTAEQERNVPLNMAQLQEHFGATLDERGVWGAWRNNSARPTMECAPAAPGAAPLYAGVSNFALEQGRGGRWTLKFPAMKDKMAGASLEQLLQATALLYCTQQEVALAAGFEIFPKNPLHPDSVHKLFGNVVGFRSIKSTAAGMVKELRAAGSSTADGALSQRPDFDAWFYAHRELQVLSGVRYIPRRPGRPSARDARDEVGAVDGEAERFTPTIPETHDSQTLSDYKAHFASWEAAFVELYNRSGRAGHSHDLETYKANIKDLRHAIDVVDARMEAVAASRAPEGGFFRPPLPPVLPGVPERAPSEEPPQQRQPGADESGGGGPDGMAEADGGGEA